MAAALTRNSASTRPLPPGRAEQQWSSGGVRLHRPRQAGLAMAVRWTLPPQMEPSMGSLIQAMVCVVVWAGGVGVIVVGRGVQVLPWPSYLFQISRASAVLPGARVIRVDGTLGSSMMVMFIGWPLWAKVSPGRPDSVQGWLPALR